MTTVREGWLYKASSQKRGGKLKRLYAVLSTRALYFFREAQGRTWCTLTPCTFPSVHC